LHVIRREIGVDQRQACWSLIGSQSERLLQGNKRLCDVARLQPKRTELELGLSVFLTDRNCNFKCFDGRSKISTLGAHQSKDRMYAGVLWLERSRKFSVQERVVEPFTELEAQPSCLEPKEWAGRGLSDEPLGGLQSLTIAPLRLERVGRSQNFSVGCSKYRRHKPKHTGRCNTPVSIGSTTRRPPCERRKTCMDVSDKTLASLGFFEVRSALAGRCRTEVGGQRARSRPFLTTRAEVEGALALVEEARRLRREPLSLPVGGLVDIRPSVDRAGKGGMLEPRELLSITQCLFAFERTGEMVSARRQAYPSLAEVADRLPTLHTLATKLERSIEPSGDISDRASPALREAREHARGLHRRIRQRLDELLRDAKFSGHLQEGYYSIRNERYVVPVQSAHQREVDGIVHNASQSGQTLFVEPKELIGLGNELAIAQSVVLEEERKVLIDLSHQVGREQSRITHGVEAAAQLDEAEAAASLANAIDAYPAQLELATGQLLLKSVRHPRLALQEGAVVVANDVTLAGDARALVVSGPNAGGKTVTLTAVGLCALMTRAGLPIPAEAGSTMPLFGQVHSAIGDQQDLQAGLSTFSAHVSALRDITRAAGTGALVLIDEIAADTDPKEGAAIATAVLESLLDKGVVVLVTTHLEELKALAHVDQRFVNARVGFDAKRMAPTYRLQLGLAGSSSAIDIARRVGLADDICARAVDLATNAGGALSKAITATEGERRKLEALRDAAEADAANAKQLKESLETQLAEANRKRKEEEAKFREALKAELEFARTQMRNLVERLSAEKSDKALKAAEKASAALTARLNEQTQAHKVAKAESQGQTIVELPLTLEVGAKARHRTLDSEVEIAAIDGETITVVAGALRMRVTAKDLAPARASIANKPPKRAPGGSRKEEALQRAEAAAAKPLALASPTLDVRGQRADDALRMLEQFLDRATREGDAGAVVLHGHGTGALKASLRDYLKHSPYVKMHRPGDSTEGGDGVTVVTLS
jgi:DNA mismatch repair protein MutS2